MIEGLDGDSAEPADADGSHLSGREEPVHVAAADAEAFGGLFDGEQDAVVGPDGHVDRRFAASSTGPSLRGDDLDGRCRVGMSVAWEVLDSASVRGAGRPWGVVWRAVDRALSGELLAERFQCSRNRAWRVAADASPGDGVLFVDDPHQIEGAVTAAGLPREDPVGLGPLLDALTRAMVEAGWERWDAEAVIGASVRLAGQPPSDGRTVLGWRPVAERFGIPPWRVRRALLALLGTETESGILRSLVEHGPRILQQESVADALRATTVRWGVPRVSACANAEFPAAQPEGASIAC